MRERKKKKERERVINTRITKRECAFYINTHIVYKTMMMMMKKSRVHEK